MHKKSLPQLMKVVKYSCICFVAVVLILLGMNLTHAGPFSNKSTNQIKSAQTNKDKNKITTQPTTNASKTPTNNELTNDQTTENTVNASITYIQQDSASLRIGTVIEAVASSGTCTLNLTKDNKTVTRTSEIQAMASTSTCKGFEIPLPELSIGTWSIKIDITLSSKQAHLSDTYTIKENPYD